MPHLKQGLLYEGEPPDLSDPNIILWDRYTPLDMALREVVRLAEGRPSWADDWEHSTRGRRPLDPLGAQASPEERLAIFQRIKRSGDLPEAAAFYLVADQVNFLTECALADEIAEAKRHLKEALGEYEELDGSRAWDEALAVHRKDRARWDRRYLALLLKSGEEEMAKLYYRDKGRFQALLQEGKRFFDPAPPA